MSWDIFVQDLPPGIASVADIPDGFVPSPIGLLEISASGVNWTATPRAVT
jgi:hypothetical protein